MFSEFDGSGVSDPTMSTEADKRNALVNTDNAGYRFRFGDSSDSRMAPAVITIGPIPDGMKRITGSDGTLVPDPATPKKPQFTTKAIKLGPGFFGSDPVAKITTITLSYYATEAASDLTVQKLVIPAKDVAKYFKAEMKDGAPTGNYVMDMAPKNIGYLLNVEIRLDTFRAKNDITTAGASVELIGMPKDVGDITVETRFRTDYENASSNVEKKDSATLHSMYVPIKPRVYASFGYVDDTNVRRHNAAVPYRWGDLDDEIAYFRYDLTNDSNYNIEDFDTDIVVNNPAGMKNDGTRDVYRGFLTRSIMMPGFVYGPTPVLDQYGNPAKDPDGNPIMENRWHYAYGAVDAIDVFDQNNATAAIMTPQADVDPNKSYAIEDTVRTLPAAGGPK